MDISLQTGRDNQSLCFEGIRRLGDSVECILVLDSNGFQARRRFRFSQLEETIRTLEQMDTDFRRVLSLAS